MMVDITTGNCTECKKEGVPVFIPSGGEGIEGVCGECLRKKEQGFRKSTTESD